jgi:Family of unknown function (DUF5681)
MSEDLKGDYEVGYRKPPKHSRFKPGQSANPAGRKKGVANFKTDLEGTLQLPVQLSEAGKTKLVSTQQAALSRLKQKALAGDGRALDEALKLASELDNAESSGAIGPMDAVDHAILMAFIEEVLSSHCQNRKWPRSFAQGCPVAWNLLDGAARISKRGQRRSGG